MRLIGTREDMVSDLKAELQRRAESIAELDTLLRGRDDFIVSEGLWQKFVDQLPK